MAAKEEDRALLKSKSPRKDRTMKEGRREANGAQDNLKLSHGPTHDGVRATLFADERGTRLRIRFLSLERFPADHLTVHFLLAPALRWRIIYRGILCVYTELLKEDDNLVVITYVTWLSLSIGSFNICAYVALIYKTSDRVP